MEIYLENKKIVVLQIDRDIFIIECNICNLSIISYLINNELTWNRKCPQT